MWSWPTETAPRKRAAEALGGVGALQCQDRRRLADGEVVEHAEGGDDHPRQEQPLKRDLAGGGAQEDRLVRRDAGQVGEVRERLSEHQRQDQADRRPQAGRERLHAQPVGQRDRHEHHGERPDQGYGFRRLPVEDRRDEEDDDYAEAGDQPDERTQAAQAPGGDHERGEEQEQQRERCATLEVGERVRSAWTPPTAVPGGTGFAKTRTRSPTVTSTSSRTLPTVKLVRSSRSGPLRSSTVTRRHETVVPCAQGASRTATTLACSVSVGIDPGAGSIVLPSGQRVTRPITVADDDQAECEDEQVDDEGAMHPSEVSQRGRTAAVALVTRKAAAASRTIVPPGGRSA